MDNKTTVLIFETEKLKNNFDEWFSDGGGEDVFYDAMECANDIEVKVAYRGNNICVSEYKNEE